MGRKIKRKKNQELELNPCPIPPDQTDDESLPLDSSTRILSRRQLMAIGLVFLSVSAILIIAQWQAIFAPLQGENIIMNTHFGGPEFDSAQLFHATSGRIMIYGCTASWGLGGGHLGGTDGWLGEIDIFGNLLWNSTYGTYQDDFINEIAECSEGGFILVGTTHSWKGEVMDNDILIIRTDSEGNLIWNQTLGGSEPDRDPHVITCADGGFAVGFTTGNFGAENWDLCLVRIDEFGNTQWNSTYGGSEMDTLCDLTSSNSGFLLFGSSPSFLQDPLSNNPDLYLVSTDATGNMIWNRTYGDWREDEGNKILRIGANRYLLVGAAGTHASSGNVWLLQITENGDVLWDTKLDPPTLCFEIISCSLGGYAFVGYYSQNYVYGDLDPYMTRIDAAGNIVWTRRYLTPLIQDALVSLIELEDGSFLMAGMTELLIGDVWLLRVIDVSPALLTTLNYVTAMLGIILVIFVTLLVLFLIRWRTGRVHQD